MKLSDFLTSDTWDEENFAIPRIGDVAGIGGSVTGCGEDDAKSLEFRADGDYAKISLSAAPGRQSGDSSKVLVVALYNGDDFIDSVKVPYGKTGSMKSKDIAAVSALRIRVWAQGDGCSNSDVFAVLYDIRVSP